MRRSLFTSLLIVLFFGSFGQIRLVPADSTKEFNWIKEKRGSIIFHSSLFLSSPAWNLGFDQMYELLDEQGVDVSRDVELNNFGVTLRSKRMLFGLEYIAGLSLFNNEEFRVGSEKIFVEQYYHGLALSFGYLIFHNHFMSIAPSIGLGFSRYSVRFTRSDLTSNFDFDNPASFSSEGSPLMNHETGYFDFGLKFMIGLHTRKRNFIFESGTLGYRHGWGSRRWKSDQATLRNQESDRLQMFYLSTTLGFALGFQNK